MPRLVQEETKQAEATQRLVPKPRQVAEGTLAEQSPSASGVTACGSYRR